MLVQATCVGVPGVWCLVRFARRGSGRVWSGLYSAPPARAAWLHAARRRWERASARALRAWRPAARGSAAPGEHSQQSAAARPPLPQPRAAGGWAPGALWQCPQQPRALVPPSVRRDVDMLESQSSRLRGTVGSWTLGSEAGPQPFFATLMQQKSRGKVVAAQRPEGRSLSGGILTRKMISGDLLEIYSTAKWDSRTVEACNCLDQARHHTTHTCARALEVAWFSKGKRRAAKTCCVHSFF